MVRHLPGLFKIEIGCGTVEQKAKKVKWRRSDLILLSRLFLAARSADLLPRQAKIGLPARQSKSVTAGVPGLVGDPAFSRQPKHGPLYGLPAAAREPQASGKKTPAFRIIVKRFMQSSHQSFSSP